MLKLPSADLFQSALNRSRTIKDRIKLPQDAPIGEIFYEPGPEDDDKAIPPYSAMEAFTKEQKREFLKLHGRAKVQHCGISTNKFDCWAQFYVDYEGKIICGTRLEPLDSGTKLSVEAAQLDPTWNQHILRLPLATVKCLQIDPNHFSLVFHVSMEKREPTRRMSKFDEIYSSRQSYFSEQIARTQKMREVQFKMFYHPHHGIYRYGIGRKLTSVYQKPEMLGVSAVAASHDGKDIVVGFGNGDFKLWDRENQVVMNVDPYARRERITRIKFFGHPYLKFLACNRAGENYLFKLKGLKPPKKIYPEEPESEVLVRKRQASHAYARSIRMASRYEDEKVSSDPERNQRLEAESEIINQQLENQMEVKPYPFAVATWECYRFSTERGNEIEALDIDATETRVITAGQDASIRLYDIKTRKVNSTHILHQSQSCKPQLLLKSFPSAKSVHISGTKSPKDVVVVSFDSDHKNLKIVSTFYGYNKDCNKTHVRPWNAGTMGGEGHYLRVYAAKFSKSRENMFITGGLDGILKVWDVRCQSSCRNIMGPMVCGDTIDSMGDTIAVGQWTKEGRIMLIDVRNEKPRTLKPMNRWHGGGYPYCLKYFTDAIESGGGLKNDLLLVGGSGYLEIVSISEEEIVCGFPDLGHIVSVDNCKNLIFSGSTEHAFNIHEFFPNIFHGDSDEPEAEYLKIPSTTQKDPVIKETSEEVPHARTKDIKRIKRAKAPEDSMIRQVKKLMVKSCKKADLTKEEIEELSKKEDVPEEISDSSLVNIPLTARKSLKVKAIIIDKIADKQMRKIIKKIRKKEMNRKEKKAMKKELMKIQGHFEPSETSVESAVLL